MDRNLRQHAALCLAKRKEVHYFDDDARFASGAVDHAWYHEWFSPEPQHRMVGESTPIYIFWKQSLERIQTYNPSMKLIVILRNPIERAYSHWSMECARGQEERSFDEAIKAELDELGSETNQCRVRSYIARGLYCDQLARMWSLFPREQTLILRHEALLVRPQEVMEETFSFLGVDPSAHVDPISVNKSDYPRGMSIAERRLLTEVFSDEIRRLEGLMGWDCRGWVDPQPSDIQ
jgi:hypothetical protein